MTRKSRVFSALAIAAAGALMITTTAYQSRAADDIHIDPGTGYAGGEVAAVTGLNTTSTGTFRYDAPGTDEDIEIASGDIKSLENAVKALSQQVVGLGDKAKAADTEVVSTTVEAVNAAKNAIISKQNSLSEDLMVVQQGISDLQTTLDSMEIGKSTPKLTLGTLSTSVTTSLGVGNNGYISAGSSLQKLSASYVLDYDGDGDISVSTSSDLVAQISSDKQKVTIASRAITAQEGALTSYNGTVTIKSSSTDTYKSITKTYKFSYGQKGVIFDADHPVSIRWTNSDNEAAVRAKFASIPSNGSYYVGGYRENITWNYNWPGWYLSDSGKKTGVYGLYEGLGSTGRDNWDVWGPNTDDGSVSNEIKTTIEGRFIKEQLRTYNGTSTEGYLIYSLGDYPKTSSFEQVLYPVIEKAL